MTESAPAGDTLITVTLGAWEHVEDRADAAEDRAEAAEAKLAAIRELIRPLSRIDYDDILAILDG